MNRATDLKLRAMQKVITDRDFIGVRIDGLNYRFYGIRHDGLFGFLYPPEFGKVSNAVMPMIFPTGSSRPMSKDWLHTDVPRLSFSYDNSLMELAHRVASDRVTKDDVHKFYKGNNIPLVGTPKNSVLGGVYLEMEDGTKGNVVWYAVPQNTRDQLNRLATLCK